jgi:hypothetical protein
MCFANTRTNAFMGSIHPRSKKPVGERLATAAFNTVYGGKAAFTGPTLVGCALSSTAGTTTTVSSSSASTLTIQFDTTLLRGDTVVLQGYGEPNFTPYYHGHGNPMFHGGSTVRVLRQKFTLVDAILVPTPVRLKRALA